MKFNRTFNLPNLYEHIPVKSANPASKIGDRGNGFVPNINGIGYMIDGGSGCFTTGNISKYIRGGDTATYQCHSIIFDASLSSPVYAAIDKVIPTYIVMEYCIKY